jgi:putative transcriptional regulator
MLMTTYHQACRAIGRNVRRLRGDRSLREVAEAVGTYPINISRIEAGEALPRADLLIRLAEWFEVSLDELAAKSVRRQRQPA